MAERSIYNRTCSECGEPLRAKNRNAKTCSTACRAKRSRRLRRQTKDAARASAAVNALPPHQKSLAEVVRNEAPELAHQVIQQELQPIVREALTDDVLSAIGQLVALTPKAVAALAYDLDSPDPKTRQTAYQLLLKYTVGNNPIVQGEREEDKRLVVHFELPRPGDEPTETVDGEVAELPPAEALRTCLVCSEEKPIDEFVANSDRCQLCHEKLQEKAKAILGEGAL